ncbi:hypothetical protein L6R52_32850 [Myxococcota bacterium]|nr:hypothetical protein [Myxococcota bacterium]
MTDALGSLESLLGSLCDQLPAAIGAVLCDFEGESVVAALGAAPVPPEAEARAREHVPRAMALTMPVGEFLMRLAGAEPCALLRLFGAPGEQHGSGAIEWIELRYEAIDMLVRRLPSDFYLVVVLRRPAVIAEAKRAMAAVSPALAEHVS